MTTSRREGPSREAVEGTLRGLDRASLAATRWYGDKGRPIEELRLEHAFTLDDVAPHVLAVVRLATGGGLGDRYLLPLTGDPLRIAEAGDGTWRALAAAMAAGRTVAALSTVLAPDGTEPGPVSAALVCRPGRAMPPGVASAPERDLGADQSNTSVVLGDAVLLKAYRRLRPGLNPELELVAYLAEEAGFSAVPPLAGYAEVVTAADEPTTIAIAQAFVADGADAYESIAEALTTWLLAPGSVSTEYATEVADDLGVLTAGLHVALAGATGVPGFDRRPATHDELRHWSVTARERFARALEVTPGAAGDELRRLAPVIAEALTVLDAVTTPPLVTRIHADYHLGQVLIAPDGYRIVDFEGPPSTPPGDLHAQQSPLRDVASMLRSLDHVGRSADRRARARNGGELERPGLDLDAWLVRARKRFIEAYHRSLREAGVPIVVDPALLRAFEVDKELDEFVYASTYLPSWLWAPTEGIRGLFADGGEVPA